MRLDGFSGMDMTYVEFRNHVLQCVLEARVPVLTVDLASFCSLRWFGRIEKKLNGLFGLMLHVQILT